jgi:hypothetical protein
MKLEVNVSDEMEDAIILESLKCHLGWLIDEPIPYSDDDQEVEDLIAAFKLVLGYYGGS